MLPRNLDKNGKANKVYITKQGLACVLDGFSRKILVWDLFPTMEGLDIEILMMRAKELYSESHARIIHDNGKQFTSREFLELVARPTGAISRLD